MDTILNLISQISAAIFGSGVLYLFLEYIFRKLGILGSKWEWYGLQIRDIILLPLSILLIIVFFDFTKPY